METLRYVLLTNGLLAVVTIAFYVLLRRETFFGANRLALWLGLTASLVLPLLRIPDWRPQPVRAVMQRTAQVIVPRVLPGSPGPQSDVTITFPNGHTYTAFPAGRTPGFTWSWQTGLIALYAAGVLLLLIRLGNQFMSLRRLIRQSEHDEYDDFTLVRNERVQSPFSFFGWVVLNPACHAPDELEQILRHERVHVRERHSFDMIGAELVCIVFWFNPAAYLFRYLLHQTLEFAADRAVLAEGVDARAYQYNLVKVSLSTGQSVITNHFSQSQLKSRIVMLNKPESTKTTWLRYPVVCLAALTVATVFARPSAQTLRKFVPAPIAETVASVVSPAEPTSDPTVPIEVSVWRDTIRQTTAQISELKTDVPPPVAVVDSARNTSGPDSTRTSPSRYMVYKGDYLYWVVTPKTTFDDFAVMKQEFAKHGHQMQLMEVKYDPLYAYIDRVIFKVVRPSGGMTQVDELDDDAKPIPSVAGYVGIGSKAGGSGTGALRYYGNEFPDALRTVAINDSLAVVKHIEKNRLEYLIHAGDNKFGYLGSGSSTFRKDDFKKTIHKASGLTVQPDGSLLVNQALETVKIFINNEPASSEAVSKLKIDHLYSVVSKTGHNPATGEQFTSALLIYTDENL